MHPLAPKRRSAFQVRNGQWAAAHGGVSQSSEDPKRLWNRRLIQKTGCLVDWPTSATSTLGAKWQTCQVVSVPKPQSAPQPDTGGSRAPAIARNSSFGGTAASGLLCPGVSQSLFRAKAPKWDADLVDFPVFWMFSLFCNSWCLVPRPSDISEN